jgi:hypothetical protein
MNKTMTYQMPVYVINLVERKDRRIRMEQQFANINSVKPKIVPAIKHSNGRTGCLLSHQLIVAMAKQLKYDMVLVIEDDCCLNVGFDKKWPSIAEWLINNKDKWDTYNGGMTAVVPNKIKLLNKRLGIARANGLKTHFIVYNSSIYDKILAIPTDIRTNAAIDVVAKHKTRMITSVPFLATQFPTFSDIRGYHYNDKERFTKAQNLIISKMHEQQ